MHLYYLPLQSCVKVHVGVDEIKGQTDVFVTSSQDLISSLLVILSDSLMKSVKNIGKHKNPFNPDARIVMAFYSKGIPYRTYIVTSGQNNLIDKEEMYVVSKVRLRILLKFLFENFTPQTRAQKLYFRALKMETSVEI